ncbi:hypothetical protein [Burkholderia multivorans]|uniref:hypothetical protein n=1 Tax=Burkholderia multivorans TaxID=87883 RepID=UPI0011B216A7|nr:hypothetical protein [Burkholderia multivorans]
MEAGLKFANPVGGLTNSIDLQLVPLKEGHSVSRERNWMSGGNGAFLDRNRRENDFARWPKTKKRVQQYFLDGEKRWHSMGSPGIA